MSDSELDGAVHRALLVSFIERGRPDSVDELARALRSDVRRVADALTRLEASHGVVLHPGTVEPWLVHPFSSTPTLFFVESPDRGWWAPCIWCALGIAVLVRNPVGITTILGGETEACRIRYDGGAVEPPGLVAHFPVPVAQAWDNVHRHCALTLVFANGASIGPWCERHGVPAGEILALEQVARLARIWYGDHLAPDWRKPTASEARARLERAGLTSSHWHVPPGDERF
jgi:hypothetical protein